MDFGVGSAVGLMGAELVNKTRDVVNGACLKTSACRLTRRLKPSCTGRRCLRAAAEKRPSAAPKSSSTLSPMRQKPSPGTGRRRSIGPNFPKSRASSGSPGIVSGVCAAGVSTQADDMIPAAIGSGREPTNPEIVEMHAHIRNVLVANFGEQAKVVGILLRGSVKPLNAREILAPPESAGRWSAARASTISTSRRSWRALCRMTA